MKALSLSCLKYSLGPILWLQGQIVRKRTPVLSEPVGERSGEMGRGRPLRILVLGDSSAAGVGVANQKSALLGHVLRALHQDYQISYQLHATTGAKTTDALADLNRMLQNEWIDKPHFDVVITALGVNDVTCQVTLKKWRQQQQSLMATIQNNLKPKLLIISGLPPMHLFPALPPPLRQYLGAWATLFDNQLQQLTTHCSNTTFLSIRDLPSTVDVAADGFHPGPGTYQQWGLAVANLINETLKPAG